jgi:transcriptional regulator with XRE-family HTH domain
MSTFGNRLRALRIEDGMTQDQLALEIGVTKGAVSQWELGVNEPDLRSVIAIREVLGGSLDDLICGSGSPTSNVALPTTREIALLQRLRALPAEKQAAVLALFDIRGEP